MSGFGEGGYGGGEGGYGGTDTGVIYAGPLVYPLSPPVNHRTAQKIKLTAFATQ